MTDASICGLGQAASNPLLSVMKHFPEDIVWVATKNTRASLAILASNFYDNPSEKLSLIGITGTNGKTSVAYFLYQLFSAHFLKCGLLSTIKIKYKY